MAISFLWFKFMNINILKCDSFPGLLPADIPSYEWMFEQRFNAAASCRTTLRPTKYPWFLEATPVPMIPFHGCSAYRIGFAKPMHRELCLWAFALAIR